MARHCRLHVRRPEGEDVARFLEACPTVFGPLGLTFDVVSDQALADPRIDKIDVGLCSNGPSQGVRDAFQSFAPAAMGPNDIVVLFARQLTGISRLGCAQHPPGVRGVSVSCAAANPMVLPHEIAHLFLGAGHDGLNSNLMFANTDQLADVPQLREDQKARLTTGVFVDELQPVGPMFVAKRRRRGPPEPVRARKARARKTRKQTAHKTTSRKRTPMTPVSRPKAKAKTSRAARRARRTNGDARQPLRYMTIIAQDPSVTQNGRILTARVAVPAENLIAGPMGYRLHVVDYDSTRQYFYGTHVLPAAYEDEPKEWRRGGPAIVRDFRFHAQNVYALVMKTLARFEFALGRRLGWSFDNHQLKIAPHGMFDANAFYSPVEEGLVFGYFKGLSGKSVFTALSHDVVVHETTHALLDALRERYLMPSNPDQAAFHEGFADVIALLSVFALPEVVGHLLAPRRGKRGGAGTIARNQIEPEALQQSALFGLADQMGKELDGLRGGALRRSAELEANPNILDDPEFSEAHRRGEVFVAAVMKAFIAAWSKRIKETGVDGQKVFPLASVIEEGADVADALATLWIRALDYMPPVHLTFQDALTAALTSDTQVRRDDERFKLRHYLKEQFSEYGIKPVAAKKGTPAGCWDTAPKNLQYDRVRFESMRSDKDEIFRFLWENRDDLELQTDAYARVLSVRPCLRTGVDGFVLRETVAEYYQVARLTPSELAERKIPPPRAFLTHLRNVKAERDAKAAKRAKATAVALARAELDADADDNDALLFGGGIEDNDAFVTAVYGGGVLIFDEYGRLKYHIHNNVFGRQQKNRLKYLWEAGLLTARVESAGYRAARLSTLHRMRAIDARKFPSEGW